MPLTVAIVGRPNVGKSTLFNRLVGRPQALVDPTPGVTRDRIEAAGRIGGFSFDVIDTAGLDEGPRDSLESRLRLQTERALAAADVAVLLIDAKAGLTGLDHEVARWLRRHPTPVVLVANKCEGRAAEAFAEEAWGLGLGPPIPISAQNGEGLAGLAEALIAHAGEASADLASTEGRPLRLVVAGRPNVGKSSLINRLLEDDRLLTGPEPGLTRDAVRIAWTWGDRRIELVDTAGLRKRARIEVGGLERLSSRASLAALREADVALLVVEAGQPLERQDLVIANRATEAGRALVLAVNKWDLVADPKATDHLIRDRLELRLPQLRGLTWLRVSATTGRGIEGILPAVATSFERWSKRVPTGELNRWLGGMTEAHAPPLHKGRRIKLRYATQVGTRPPTFVVFVSQAGVLPEAYLRYLANGLRHAFDLGGLPLRLLTRTGANPYV
jgi:GTP-binding protein